jgi:hypothetical protein
MGDLARRMFRIRRCRALWAPLGIARDVMPTQTGLGCSSTNRPAVAMDTLGVAPACARFEGIKRGMNGRVTWSFATKCMRALGSPPISSGVRRRQAELLTPLTHKHRRCQINGICSFVFHISFYVPRAR